MHLGWQLKESQRKASRQRTDVQEEKHEKRRGAIDAVASASQHLRTIKATSATVAVRFLRGGGVRPLKSLQLWPFESSSIAVQDQLPELPGRKAAEWTHEHKEKWRKEKYLFFFCVFVLMHQKGSCQSLTAEVKIWWCQQENIISTYCLSNDRYVYSNYLMIILINVTLVWLCLQPVQWLTTSSEEKQSCSSYSTSCCAAVVSLVHC